MTPQERMEQMAREEIQSASDLEQRLILKELTEHIFLPLYEENKNMYQQLEERIMNDLSYDVNKYLLRTGMAERGVFDPTNQCMSVMQEQDFEARELTIKDARQAIAADGRCCIGTIFLRCDYLEIQQILTAYCHSSVTIEAGEDFEVSCILEQNKSYLEKAEELYHLFAKNGIPWQIVNCPYLFKLADVYVTDIPQKCQDNERIQAFRVDLGEYTVCACYDLMPVWNIWHFKQDTIGFPLPSLEYKGYEHNIAIDDFSEECKYLFEGKSEIAGVRQEGKKITLISQEEKSQQWDVYCIRNSRDEKDVNEACPVMENYRVDGFAERYQRKTGKIVKTKMELERFILGFGLNGDLEYLDSKIVDRLDSVPETYAMNPFLKDEIREDKRQMQLVLEFRPNGAGKTPWLARDLMSFIVSEVQERYPEYECLGRLQ